MFIIYTVAPESPVQLPNTKAIAVNAPPPVSGRYCTEILTYTINCLLIVISYSHTSNEIWNIFLVAL